jgi:hypothetical protein
MRRLTVLMVILALAVAACGDDTSPSAGSSSSTDPADRCTGIGGLDDRSGAARLSAKQPPPIPLLANVQVQASGCVDEIAFLFYGGIPGWSVRYEEGPFTQDGSGDPVTVAGEAFLRVRLEPASGVDLSGDSANQVYDGPTSLRPPRPSGVSEIVRAGDFEAVTTWIVGLPGRRPFEVVQRDEQLVIRMAADAPRATSCSLTGAPLRIGYPDDWYAELSDRWSCRYFDPAPFAVYPATNDFRWRVTVVVADAPASVVLDRVDADGSTITKTATRVGGLPATRIDVKETGDGMLPAGWGYRMYVVDTGGNAVTIMGAAAGTEAGIAANARDADTIAELAVQP